jgi:ribosomal protein S18 acetylase RimI-like enzyme
VTVRRLGPDDAAIFRALRLEGFARHPLEFRIAPEDETSLTMAQVEARITNDYVVGAFALGGALAGIGGLTRYAGAKLQHKALLWGMYVREGARGQGLGDAIVVDLLAHARATGVEIVQLTVVADNTRARRLYERHGFTAYGTEPSAVKAQAGEGVVYLDETLMFARLQPVPSQGKPRP